jgi:hypothetical protein
MYRGFNVEPDNAGILWNNKEYFQAGLKSNENFKSAVSATLSKFATSDGSLNGSSIQENWFPNFTPDVFISHSHKDYSSAVSLAGWLKEQFKLNAFVDSCVWGYAGDLLRIIDNEYCLNSNRETYNYEKRNYSTSHVHMMLSTALTKMMDSSECLFFLNTPQSLNANETIENTESPWIYFEMSSSKYLKTSIPSRMLRSERTKYFAKGENVDESLRIKYDLNIKHLSKLPRLTQALWVIQNNKAHSLDSLYELVPIEGLQIING